MLTRGGWDRCWRRRRGILAEQTHRPPVRSASGFA
jgi:hypothetical protein